MTLPPEVAETFAQVKDLQTAAEQLQADLKYPVDHRNQVIVTAALPEYLIPALVIHLVRCGWRKDPDKALIKSRQVVGSVFTDLVAWVPLSDPDDPIVASERVEEKRWSVRPKVNVIDEKRPT